MRVIDRGKVIEVECFDCWDNEGSRACLRMAHKTTEAGIPAGAIQGRTVDLTICDDVIKTPSQAETLERLRQQYPTGSLTLMTDVPQESLESQRTAFRNIISGATESLGQIDKELERRRLSQKIHVLSALPLPGDQFSVDGRVYSVESLHTKQIDPDSRPNYQRLPFQP